MSAINSTSAAYTYVRVNFMKKAVEKLKEKIIFLVVIIFAVALILFRQQVGKGIQNGLSVVAEVLVPSLFPFMVLSSFSAESGVFERGNKLFSALMKFLFRLPADCFSVFYFGFTGGYPVGARVAVKLKEQNRLSDSDFAHIFSFCVNAGPSFVITATGERILGCAKAGYVIFASLCISSLITGIVYGRLKPSLITSEIKKCVRKDFASALTDSVSSATAGILSVSAWVLLFSALMPVLELFIGNRKILLLVSAVSEVSSGIRAAAELGGIPFVSACIAFGGLSVAFQLLSAIKKCGVKVKTYFFFRIVNAVLSYSVTKIILCFVDVSIDVFAYNAEIYSSNALASAALLVMSALFIFQIRDSLYLISFRKTNFSR